jgi:CheY-like chemotaxis protein
MQTSPSILLVEDQILVARAEKLQLEEYGYNVYHVTSGGAAIKFLEANVLSVDLILMDIDLGPGMDGLHAAITILESRDIPLVFLSSHTDKAMIEKTETISPYGYVVKSSEIDVLDAAIKMALDLSKTKK